MDSQIFLIVDGENFGPLDGISNETEYADFYGDDILIKKSFVTDHYYLLDGNGFTFHARKVMIITEENQNPPIGKVLIDGCDIFEADIYPEHNHQNAERAMQVCKTYGIPYDMHVLGTSAKISSGTMVPVESAQGKLQAALPDLATEAACPTPKDDKFNFGISCGTRLSLWYMIQHLNDHHEWSREQIADWLETLDVNITFQIGVDYEDKD